MTDPYEGPEFRRLLERARRSLERTGGDLSGSVSLSHPDDAERKAIIGITGQYRDTRTNRVAVRLADLDRAVRETTGRGLAELLAGLGGPLHDRPAERNALAAARDAADSAARASSLHASCAWYRDWLAEIGRDGSLTKLVNQREQARLGQAVRVLEDLAGRRDAPVLLPALAAGVTGDTKALNHGTLLSTLVLRALAIKAGTGRPGTAGERRDLWEASGVVVDDLASRVLVLNLPAEGAGLAEWLAGAARLGVPFYATLHQLMTLPLTIRGAVVHVCENPAVLRHAAAELGPGAAPLLCTEGRPSAAFHQLADAIVSGGGELRYHGDFDWPGLAIAGAVMRRHGATPWRMAAGDYLAGVRVHAEHVPLSGTPQPTPWDPELTKAMAATGRVLFEESVADDLIGDLSGLEPERAAKRKRELACYSAWFHRTAAGLLSILGLMLTRRTFLQLMAASTGVAITGSEFLAQTAARAATALSPNGSNGVKHVVVLMMENRSFDHFLGWLPGADGRHDLIYPSTDGNYYRNYPLAPDFQGCGYSDPDHSWEGFLVQHNYGKMDGFLQRPTAPADNPGVTLAQANTFPIGYYTNFHADHGRKAVPDLPVTGALAEHYTVLDRYFCSFAGETFPNRFYQHAARTDRDHNSFAISALPAIWDQLSPIPNNQGIPTGGYFFRDLPFLALWGTRYFPFWHPFADGDTDALGIPVTTKSFIDTVAQGELPNVSLIDPAFDTEGNGTSADDHPLADIRLGERFIADAYHALASAGYLDDTVLIVTFDEWGGFYDHVPPPQVIDDTNPADVDHTGDASTPTDGQLIPDYRQLGFRVPAIVVSNLARRQVVHDGPFEHTSTLKLIETTFGLHSLTARDAHAESLGQVLDRFPRPGVAAGAIPTSSQVLGPVSDAAAICSADSVQSVSPAPVQTGRSREPQPPFSLPGWPTGSGMAGFGTHYRNEQGG